MAYHPTYEEKYVPDMSVWTNLGACPLRAARILKINNTLYAFGCYTSVASSSIYSTAWNNPTGWVDTGVSVSGLGYDSYVYVVDSTIYSFANWTNGAHVLTAPVSNPLSWTDTGQHLTTISRDNAALVVTPTHVCLLGGYRGSGTGNIIYAPVATPTTFTAGGSFGAWQSGGCYLDTTDIHAFGGVSNNSTIWSFMSNAPIKTTYTSTSVPGYAIDTTPAVFHVEDRVYVTGNTNSNLYSGPSDNMHVPWDVHSVVMPGNVSYPTMNWIGPDGYAYLVGNTNNEMYRSGRKRIFVVDPPARTGTYTNRHAVTESGGKSAYTIHCQMGMAPWYTNRRDKF
jgi:hypothetical protein